MSAPAQADRAGPRLTKAGISCAKGEGNTSCLLFIRAKHGGKVDFRLSRDKKFQPAAPWGRDIYGAKQWYRNPVRGDKCLRVWARASNKRGEDQGRVRLCDAGWGPATSPFESAWTYADYERF